MTEYIVSVSDEQAAQLIEQFGIEGCTLGGFQITGEVVRCRDCEGARHYHPFVSGKRSAIEVWYCEWHSNPEGASEIEPDGFCAWGERK